MYTFEFRYRDGKNELFEGVISSEIYDGELREITGDELLNFNYLNTNYILIKTKDENISISVKDLLFARVRPMD